MGTPQETSDSPPRGLAGLRRLPPSVRRTGLVSFFADISSEMLYPLTPILLTTVLGAPVAVVGVIEGVAEAVSSLVRPLAGRLSDRRGRRVPFMAWGYGLSAIGKPLIALSSAWPFVLLARGVDRLGKGIRTGPRDAYLADAVDEADRGLAFGWHRALDTSGAVVGALLCLLLLWLTRGDIRLVIWLATLPAVGSVVLVLQLRDHRAKPAEAGSAAWFETGALNKPFRWYLVAWGTFAVANSSDAFLILKARSVGLSTTSTVLLYVLYNVTYALTSPRLGSLSDRVGRRRVLIGGLVIFVAVYAGFAVASTWQQLVALFGVYGLYVAATEGVGKAFAVDLVPADLRASAIGLHGLVVGVATLVASSVAGVLWSAVGPWATFSYGAAGAALCALMMLMSPVLRRTR